MTSGKKSYWLWTAGPQRLIPPDILEDVELRQGAPFLRGVEYEVANGVQISNLEECEFTGVIAEGSMKTVVAQVCDVNRCLLSVRKIGRKPGTELFLTMREVTLRTKPRAR